MPTALPRPARLSLSLLLALSAAGGTAWACPTLVTGTPSQLSFDVAQLALVRQGNRTTFSVSVNPSGEPQDFALLLPVPEVPSEEEVKTLDAEVFARLDGYTGPRHVSDAGCIPSNAEGGDGAGGGGGDDGEVDVVAEYLVGEYRVFILSAEESGALQEWLDGHGFQLAPGADPILAEYIEAGSFFFAAQVADTAAMADGSSLSPLQVSYESEVFSVPIRLATLNSPGSQDMVIYTIVDGAAGKVGISNYTEFEVPDRCIWGAPTDDFKAFYEERFTSAWAATGTAGWTTEFSGGISSCNPCSGVYPTEQDLQDLGFVGAFDSHFMTRMRMRYTPEQASADLIFYTSNILEDKVLSFADDTTANRECIELCDTSGTGEGDSGGSDGADGADGSDGADGAGGSDGAAEDGGGAAEPAEKAGCGCASAPRAPVTSLLGLGLFGLALGLRRRG